MRWPFKKQKTKGKVAINQKQSHHRNVERELRDNGSIDPRIRKHPDSNRVNWGED